jgi:hypothetical protein
MDNGNKKEDITIYFPENLSNINIDFEYLSKIKDHKFFGFFCDKIEKYPSKIIKKRLIDLIKILNSSNINHNLIREYMTEGVPDELPGLRSILWKILFGVLPLNINLWEEKLDDKRTKYNKLKENTIVKLELAQKNMENNKKEEKNGGGSNNNSGKQTLPQKQNSFKIDKSMDHPLNTSSNSLWKTYFDDQTLYEEVYKDVRRTRTHMSFFFMPAFNEDGKNKITNEELLELNLHNHNNNKKKDSNSSKIKFESNADVLCRILFIYAKKYPKIRYVQGMNEVLAPIYYCFSLDKNPYFIYNVEADAFICFENFMNKIQDIFVREKDNSETGINVRLRKINEILKIIDKDLYNHFLNEKIELQFFAFRWYTLFFTQELELPEVLRLWDTILSEENIFDFMTFLCLAVIKQKRSELIAQDFSGIMTTLQNLEKINVENTIQYANDIRENYYGKHMK